MMEKFLNQLGGIDEIKILPLEISISFVEWVGQFAQIPGMVALMSGGDLDCARYHILGIEPEFIMTSKDITVQINFNGHKFVYQMDPFVAVQKLVQFSQIKNPHPHIPISCGLMGYFAYDLKNNIEDLHQTAIDTLHLPHLFLASPKIIIVHDKKANETSICYLKRKKEAKGTQEKLLNKIYAKCTSSFYTGQYNGDPKGFESNFKKADYLATIEKIIEYIRLGHVYQVNLSQQFHMEFNGDGFALFKKLYHLNPAPFFSYVNAGDHQIVSTSPERFLLRNGNFVETRPIKGTRPRGQTNEEDIKMKQSLLNSPKDEAELSMIVDLLRNDIGKVCAEGSVKVNVHKRVEAYENVFHLVSIISGRLRPDQDSVDLIRAAFPGGSITGCPKVRSMEIIDELEPNLRHVYTGSIGYLSYHNTMDLSIAIRTAIIHNKYIYFNVGGGIVFDSQPLDEYQETLHKGQTLMKGFSGDLKVDRAAHKQSEQVIWVDGALSQTKNIEMALDDPGFCYGHGFFETIRVDNEKPLYLSAHMARFQKAWTSLFATNFPQLSWDEIIRQVIRANSLQQDVAAVKIIAAQKKPIKNPYPFLIAVTAKVYQHRLAGTQKKGCILKTYDLARQTPLADHKTLNYLYYFRAGQWAKSNGYDEALILNPDDTISETNSANLFFIKDQTMTIPESLHALPGVMLNEVKNELRDKGFHIKQQSIKKNEIIHFDCAYMTNSLIGCVPILKIDDQEFGLEDIPIRKWF